MERRITFYDGAGPPSRNGGMAGVGDAPHEPVDSKPEVKLVEAAVVPKPAERPTVNPLLFDRTGHRFPGIAPNIGA